MDNSILYGAAIGSLFTIITHLIVERIKRNGVKKTVNHYLRTISKGTIVSLKKEQIKFKEFIKLKERENFTFGTHPAFNTEILDSFDKDHLYSSFKEKKYTALLSIIGMIRHIENNLPIKKSREFADFVSSHIKENNDSELFDTDLDHFQRCGSIENQREIHSNNIDHLNKVISELEESIKIVLE